jgi:hypothetical protein
MKKLGLTEWAAIGELIATLGVVISLLFVAYSINRNTEVNQASTENLIFEQHAELANLVMADPSLANILAKMRDSTPELTPVEAIRWEKYQMNLLDIWAMAYMRHRDDLLSGDQWKAWDGYFSKLFKDGGEKLSRLRWEQLEYGYDHEFWEHMGKAIFGG